MALMGQVSLITVNRPPARECASVRGDYETTAATTTLKIQRKVSIASWQLPNHLHFRFAAEHNSSVGHRSPSRDLSRYLINCRSGRALAKSAVSRLRSENREGNAEHSTPTNTEHPKSNIECGRLTFATANPSFHLPGLRRDELADLTSVLIPLTADYSMASR